MICPKCSAETVVLSTRKEAGGTVLRRRRACNACGHEFGTTESTIDVAARRRADAAGQRVRRLCDPERFREREARSREQKRLRKLARAEAAATNKPVIEVMRAWGVQPTRADL